MARKKPATAPAGNVVTLSTWRKPVEVPPTKERPKCELEHILEIRMALSDEVFSAWLAIGRMVVAAHGGQT